MYGGVYRRIQTQGVEKDDVRRMTFHAEYKQDIPESVHKYGDTWPPQGSWNLEGEGGEGEGEGEGEEGGT